MKNVIVLASMMFLAACSYKDGSDGATGPQGPAGTAPQNASILSKWVSNNPTSRIPELNLSQLTLNAQQSITTVRDCVAELNGQSDVAGSGNVNGVAKNALSISGSSSSGLIQFGRLSHANQNLNNVCYTIGQELYSYSVEGNQMILCDLKYAVCGVFTAQ